MVSACGPRDEAPSRALRYPLVAYATDHAWRTQTTGEWEATWLRVRDTSSRALVARRGAATLTFRLDDLAGGELRARVGLLATGAASEGSARFAVRVLRSGTGEAFATLFDERLAMGPLRDLRLLLPPEAFRVRLEVTPDARAVASGAWSVWLEPELVHEVPRPAPEPGAPSVLLVTVDTLRADVLGSYGGPVPTPHLERLVRRGVRFEQAHSVAFGTTPSHASLLTARPASQHGVRDNLGVLRRDELTLAEVLAQRGYHTAAFVSGVPLSRRLNLAQGFDLYDDAFISDLEARLGGTARAQRRADRTAEQFLRWLDGLPAGEPFFAWVHWFDPHQPYDPPRPGGHAALLRASTLLGRSEPEFARVAEAAWARYLGEVAFVDRQLGRVLDRVEQRGDAVVVFTADHGETFRDRGRHLAFDHTTLHGEVTRVPLVVAAPEGVLAPRTFGSLVASTDVAPTVLGLLGLAAPEPFEGLDLLPWLGPGGPEGEPRNHLRLEGAGGEQLAIRTPDWLYRVTRKPRAGQRLALGFEPGQAAALHALAEDPGERRDVAADHAAVAQRLASLAREGPREGGGEEAGGAVAPRRGLELDPAHRAALEQLGYADPGPD